MQGSAADKKRTKRTKHSSWEFVFRIIPWFRSPFPVWVQAAAAVAIVVLTFFIFQVTDEQRKIARNANRILGLQSTIMAGQAVIMKNQSEIMKRQAEEAGAQSRILENNDRIVRAINRAAVYPEVGLTIFRAKNKTIIGISLVFANLGNTPTKGLVAGYGCYETRRGKHKPEPFANFVWEESTKTKLTVGPKQRIGVQVCQIDPPEVPAIVDHDVHKFVIAEVRYSDVIDPDTARVTRLVRRIHIGVDREISHQAVGQNNCTDEDCP